MWPRQRQTLSTAACQRHATRQSNENPTPLSTKATATAKHCNSRGLKLQRRTLSLRASLRSQCAPPHCEALSEPVENSLSSSSHACKSRACKISRRPPGLHARSSHARVRLSRLPPPTLSLCVNLSARAATPPSQPLSSVRWRRSGPLSGKAGRLGPRTSNLVHIVCRWYTLCTLSE